MSAVPIGAVLSVLLVLSITGCDSGNPNDSIESLSHHPEALKEAHRRCRLKLEGADEKYCRAVAEAERERFFRAVEKELKPDAAADPSPSAGGAASKP